MFAGYIFSGQMGQAFGQQQQQQPFGGMGGVSPAPMGQPASNPTNPFNMAAAPSQQIPQQQQQQQIQQLFPGQQQQPQQHQNSTPSFDISDEFLGLGGSGAAKQQPEERPPQQPERPAELSVGDPFRAATPVNSGEQPAASASAGGDGFGQGEIRRSSSSLSRVLNPAPGYEETYQRQQNALCQMISGYSVHIWISS